MVLADCFHGSASPNAMRSLSACMLAVEMPNLLKASLKRRFVPTTMPMSASTSAPKSPVESPMKATGGPNKLRRSATNRALSKAVRTRQVSSPSLVADDKCDCAGTSVLPLLGSMLFATTGGGFAPVTALASVASNISELQLALTTSTTTAALDNAESTSGALGCNSTRLPICWSPCNVAPDNTRESSNRAFDSTSNRSISSSHCTKRRWSKHGRGS
mmetsp:Transcript_87175/g.244604  ORF Transcript_87175/g.244604 Transcript_87175/m.244604 type:complete len:217 (-) Transcript_87175:1262-1912(-)